MPKNLSLIIVIFLLITPACFLENTSGIVSNKKDSVINEKPEIFLLRVEHYLYLLGGKNTDIFNVRYAFPPIYNYQVPILLEIYNDTTEDIIKYKIENDSLEPNKFVNFTVKKIEKDEEKLIHFTIWVLVENNKFEDLPETKEFPEKENLPDNTKKWLSKTDVVQKDNIFIKLKSRQMKLFYKDLISYADRVSFYIKNHRFLLFLLELKTGLFFSQDAVTTLFINGENVGRSHLACALLRNQNIPTRVLLVNNDQRFWTQMHYMIEYYVPEYGWVLLDTTKGETPYESKRQVINRICHPEDENDTKKDYILPFMKGEERWIWINNENVKPYYIDCKEGSKSQMFTEGKKIASKNLSDNYFNYTKTTFHKYQKFIGMDLSCKNQIFLKNAVSFQKKAINYLNKNNLEKYYNYVKLANEEYKKIKL